MPSTHQTSPPITHSPRIGPTCHLHPFMRLLLSLLLCGTSQAAELVSDVIVYGATPAGFCAAIAASREGTSVTLLEPSNHIGGVNTGGLSFSDSNQTVRSTVMGLFHEWHSRIEADYTARGITLPYQVSVKDNAHWTYEPHVAMRVTRQMLEEARVLTLPARTLTSVTLEDARLTILHTTDGSYRAKVFIDATYEGDLMAMAGVSWTIGREARSDFNESYAGKQYPKPKMTISGLTDTGTPLPLITTTDAGPEASGDSNVMVYSFRLCLTNDPANRLPFPTPDHYDPSRFEVARRWFLQQKNPPLLWDLYPLPGKKFDANNGIGKQFSMGLVGACNGWSEAGPATRAQIWEAHRQYTLELYHFLTTDPAVPEKQRTQLAELGLAKDEFPDNAHWSPQLYVREGRRMKGLHILTQKDILTDPSKEDPIAVSSFPIDSHDCQRIASPDGKTVVNEGTIFPVRMPGRKHGYPYHVPFRSILPLAEECENLIVPVALSCTHVAISSIRVEPTWMILGQSAGIAAALASKDDTNAPVQSLPYPILRARLLAQGQVLDLPILPTLPPKPDHPTSIDPASLPGLVRDDSDAQLSGPWVASANFKPHLGKGYLHDDQRADGQCTATFTFPIETTATYDLRFAYSPHETRATNIPITLETNGKKATLLLDQTLPLSPGDPFRTLAQLDLKAGQTLTLTLSNQNTDGFVILDGVSLVESATFDK
jgi:hypothetical protein